MLSDTVKSSPIRDPNIMIFWRKAGPFITRWTQNDRNRSGFYQGCLQWRPALHSSVETHSVQSNTETHNPVKQTHTSSLQASEGVWDVKVRDVYRKNRITRTAVDGVSSPSFSANSGAVAFRQAWDHCFLKISIRFIPEPSWKRNTWLNEDQTS